MMPKNLPNGLRFRKTTKPARRPASIHLGVELLENRLTPAVATPSQNFVSQAYLDLLQRQVDPGGLAAWSKQVDSGVSRTQVVIGIMGSPEFLTKEQINPLYKKSLDRVADPGGLAADLSFLQNGGKLEQVAIAILGSPEFLTVHGGTNDGWLDGAYAALGIGLPSGTVDAGGRAGWDSVFALGVTRERIAPLLVNSIQFIENSVTQFYKGFLKRDVDPAGLASWTAVEQQLGGSFVLANIVGSQEYFQRAQSNPQTPLPTVASFNPGTGAIGTSVTITGTFLNTTTGVTIAGTALAAKDFSVKSDTQIVATIPAGAAAATGPIVVTTTFGTGSSSSNFTIGPGITSFVPGSGPQGTSVVITGTNFTGATAVTIAGLSVPAAEFSVDSAIQITATVPTGGTVGTSGAITVTTAFGTATSASSFLLTAAGSPTITSFLPSNGDTGTTVTITGTNLFGVTSVTFNGVAASIVGGSNTSTQVQVTAPASTNGIIVVTTTPGNTGQTAAIFSYPPTLATITPSGIVGATITITGTNFLGATSVQFAGGVSAVPSVTNNGSLTVVVPAGAQSGNVTVTTAGGTTAGIAFTVKPNVTGVSPTQGHHDNVVTLTGTTLNAGSVSVSYNGTTLATSSITATQIVLTIPNPPPASFGFSGPFTVNTSGGSANSPNFTITLQDDDVDIGAGDNSIFADTDGDGF